MITGIVVLTLAVTLFDSVHSSYLHSSEGTYVHVRVGLPFVYSYMHINHMLMRMCMCILT